MIAPVVSALQKLAVILVSKKKKKVSMSGNIIKG